MSLLCVFDGGDHFVSSLELADLHMRVRRKDITNVRWIVIGLHDALHSLLIEKLCNTDGFGIYSDKFEQKVADFYKVELENGAGLGSDTPEFHKLLEASNSQNIANLGTLLKRAKLSPEVCILYRDIENAAGLSRGISRLKKLRNHLAHPKPMLAGYDEDYLTSAFQDTLAIIELVLELPDKRYLDFDPQEVAILMGSIKLHLTKWLEESASLKAQNS